MWFNKAQGLARAPYAVLCIFATSTSNHLLIAADIQRDTPWCLMSSSEGWQELQSAAEGRTQPRASRRFGAERPQAALTSSCLTLLLNPLTWYHLNRGAFPTSGWLDLLFPAVHKRAAAGFVTGAGRVDGASGLTPIGLWREICLREDYAGHLREQEETNTRWQMPHWGSEPFQRKALPKEVTG